MRKFFVVLAAFALLTTPALARSSHHHRHHHCKAGYTRKHVWGKHHKRHVWRCVKTAKKHATQPPGSGTTTGAARAKVSYRAKVDPTFTQAPADPLAVTYQYSADATSTLNAVTTDLAATGQLPAGILNFYSPAVPGQPAGLVCSMNVGGATVGGSCPVTYTGTGTYDVTTEYIPNGTTAVTQTDVETIAPYATTTTLASFSDGMFTYYRPAVTDQNGNSLSAPASTLSWLITDTTTGQEAGTLPFAGDPSAAGGDHFAWGQSGSSPTICVATGVCTAAVNGSDSFSIAAVYSPAPTGGWAGSTSQPLPLSVTF